MSLAYASTAALDVLSQLPGGGGDLSLIKAIDRSGWARDVACPDGSALERILADPVVGIELADGTTRWFDVTIDLRRQIARGIRDAAGTMTHILGSTAELGQVGGSEGDMTAIGAHDLLDPELLDPELLDAVKQLEGRFGVIANEVEFTAGNTAARQARAAPFEMTAFPGVERLSDREREIFTLLADGLRPVTIARRVFLSPSTIRNHLSSTYKKLGVSSQIELMTRLVEFRATGRHS